MYEKEIKPRLLIFASGTKDGGGSGFGALVEAQRCGLLDAEIVGVVSQYKNGGVRKIADLQDIRFYYFSRSWELLDSHSTMEETGAEWVAFSGWVKKIKCLNPKTTFNIHPARLAFGGRGMYGAHIHQAVINSYRKGLIKDTAFCMHFVTEEYDKGPVFFEHPVPIYPDDTPAILQERVKNMEHLFQWAVTNLVVHKKISWDGKDPQSLIVPKDCLFLPKSW